MKEAILILIILHLSLLCFAQEPTTIRVIKKDGKEVFTDEVGEELNNKELFRWQPWMVWDQGAQAFRPDVDVFPSLGLEYDISKKETAHFYNLGCDVGTERLMLGMVVRLPSHNPRLEDLGGIQMSFRTVKRWDFRKLRTTQLRIIQKKIAHFQAGLEYIIDTHVDSRNSELDSPNRVTFISPTVGVFHPIYEHFLIGLKLKRNISMHKEMSSYSDMSINFSYFLDL